MILSGNTLKTIFTSGLWKSNVEPSKLKYNPNSIDVTLSPYIFVTKDSVDELDPFFSNPLDFFRLEESDGYILKPQQFVLASVNEAFNCSNSYKGNYFTQMYDGRSTIARMGMHTHISAGFGDYGFKGAFTLEIVNNAPYSIKLYKDIRIGQIYFVQLDSDSPMIEYLGYCQNDGIPELPRLGKHRF